VQELLGRRKHVHYKKVLDFCSGFEKIDGFVCRLREPRSDGQIGPDADVQTEFGGEEEYNTNGCEHSHSNKTAERIPKISILLELRFVFNGLPSDRRYPEVRQTSTRIHKLVSITSS